MMTLSRSSQGDSVKKDSRKRYIDTSDDSRSDRDRRDKKKHSDLSSSKRDRRENRDDRREHGSSSRLSRDHDSSDTLNRRSQDRDSASSDKGNFCKSLVDYAESDKEAKHDERYSKKKKKKKKKHSGKQAENDSDNSSEGPKPEKRRRLSTSSKKRKKSSKWSSDEEDVLPKKEQVPEASVSQEFSFKKEANRESSHLLKNRWDDKEKAESSYDWRKERNDSVGEKDRVRSKWDFDTSDDDDDDDEDDAVSLKVPESQSSKGRSVVGDLSKEKSSRWSSAKESSDESDFSDGNDKNKQRKEPTERSSSKDRESLFASSEFSKEGSVEKLKRKGKLLETQEGPHKVLKVSKEFSGKFSRREDLSASRAETGSTVIESLKGQSPDSVDTRMGEQTELRDHLEDQESLRESQNDSPELETRTKERISLKGKQSPLGKIETPKDLEKVPHGKSSCHLPESGEVVGDQSRENKIGEKLNRKNEIEERAKDREGGGDLSKVSNTMKNETTVSSKQKPSPESYGLEGLKSSREIHGDKDRDDIHITDEDHEKLQMKRRITSERCLEGKKQSLGELKETSKETVGESDKYGDLPSERNRHQYTKGSGHDTEPSKKCRSPEKDGNIEERSDSKGSTCSNEEKNASEKYGRQREGLKLSRWDRDASEDSNKESSGLKDQYKKKSDSGDLCLEKEDLKNQQERSSSKERYKGKADSQNQNRERSDSESEHSDRSDSRDQRHGRSSSKVHRVEGSDSESSHHDKSESEDQHSARSDSDRQSRDKSSSKRQGDRDDSRSRRWEREESSEPHRERDESKDRHQEKEDYSSRDWRRDRDSSRERRRNPDDSRERHYARDDSRERHRDRDSYDTKRSRDDSRERQKDRDDYGGRYRYRDQPRDNWRFRDNRRYQNDGWDNRRGRFNFRGGFKYRDSSRERQRYRDDSRDYRRDRDNRKDSDRDSDKHRRQDSYDQRHSSWRDRNRSSSPDRYRSKENSGRENKTRKSDTSSSSKRLNGSPDRHYSADSSPDHHRSNNEKTSNSAQKNQQQEKRTTDLSDKPTSDTSVPKSSGSGETTTASSKPINPSKDPTGAGILTTRTGGAYIPPARLKMMQTQITDKSSVAYQRLSWEALRKSINGHINKVNVTNIIGIVRDLFQENIVRGRGLLARSLLQAQIASPTFTHVYAALVAIINTKFPQNGELILRRLIIQFRRAFKRNDKTVCISSCRYIAHLVNQQVAHEVIALEILTLLLENPTNNSVEVAVGFLKECGQKLTEVSPRGVNAIFERLKNILHEGKLEMRTQYIIEVMFAVRKDGFKDHPAVIDELDLVLEADQFTHLLTLDDAVGGDDILNVFKQDDNFLENEEKYNLLKEEILNSSSDESSDESGDGSQSDSGSEAGGGGADDAEHTEQIIDKTETNLVALRCTIYLTIQSSVDFEECAHKLLKMDLKPGQEIELCNMILDCCAQERTYQKFFGLLAQRFCMVDKKYVDPFQQIFKQQYETIHRLDPDKFRNVAKFFAHLLHTDAISWQVMSCIKLSKEDTSSASRIFLKILFQELSEYMGLPKLNYRFKDPTLQPYFEGIMPRDVLKNTRFAINFFTTIGLGGLTDDLREHLKNMAKVALQQKQQEPSMNSPASGTEDSSSDSSSDSSDSSSDSSGNSSDSSSDSSDSTPADKAEAAVKKKKVLTKKRPVAKDSSAGANSKTSSSSHNNNNNNNNKLVAVSNNISSKKKKKNQSSSSSSSGSSSSGSSSSSSSSSESSSSDSSSSSSSDSDDSLSSSSSNGSSSNAGGEDEHTVDSSESSTDSGSSSDSSSSSSSSASGSSSDTMRSTALDEKRRRDNNEATVNHKHRSREDHSSGKDAINGLNQQGYTTAGGSHRKESRLGPRETDERVTHLADTRDRNHERDHRPMEWSRNDSAGAPLPPPRNSRGGGGGGGDSDDDDDEIERSRRVRGGEKRGSRSGGGYVDRVGSYASSSSNTADQWDKNRRDWDRSQNRGYELDRFGDRGDRTDRYYDKDRNGDRSDRYYDKERNERESYRRNSDRGDGNGGRRDPRQKRYRNDYVNNSNNRRDSYIQKDRVGHGDRERTEKYRNRD